MIPNNILFLIRIADSEKDGILFKNKISKKLHLIVDFYFFLKQKILDLHSFDNLIS